MKLIRLASTILPITSDPHAQTHGNAHEPALKVEAIEALAADRQRSLQQELASINPEAIGDYHGQAQIAASVHELAIALTTQHALASRLIDPNKITSTPRPSVDEEA